MSGVGRRLRHLRGLLGDIWALARASRAWWIVPVTVVLLLLGLLLVVGSATLVFVYPLF